MARPASLSIDARGVGLTLVHEEADVIDAQRYFNVMRAYLWFKRVRR